MAKKTLEAQIKNVSWWAIGLSVLYFSVGAYLNSNGSHFDPAKTYDLIKDTFTLTAAFLAPVAAFVIFSGWRVQHKELSNEENSRLIINAFDVCHSSISYYVKSVDFHTQYSNFMNNLFIINTLTNEIYPIDENSSQFLQNAKVASTQLNSDLPKWIHLVNLHQQDTSGYNNAQLMSFNELQSKMINEYSVELQKIARIRTNLVHLKI